MAGIYVNAGAAPGNTVGGVTVPSTCDPLFYRNGCNPRFDPIATNNLMSEVLRAINAFGDQYNCESHDNLRNALLKARNLCGLPVNSPDLDDFIAGCFDGSSGLVPIQQLQSLFGICNLPSATSPDNDDTLGMCVDGFNAQVPVSALRDLIIGQIPTPNSGSPAYRRGGQFWAERWGETQDDTRTLDVGTRNAFVIRADNEVLGGNFYIRLGGINIYAESAVFQRMQGGVWHCLSTNHGTDWYNTTQTGNTFGVVKASTSSPIGGDGTSGVGRVYDAILLTPQI